MGEDWVGRGLENGRKCRSERKDGWKNEKSLKGLTQERIWKRERDWKRKQTVS